LGIAFDDSHVLRLRDAKCGDQLQGEDRAYEPCFTQWLRTPCFALT
jgi:hypothetical protein